MNKIKKTLSATLFSLILCCVFIAPVQAASYDAGAALSYASKHWNDGKGLCAEFVSDCLKAGGCKGVYSKGATNMVGLLKKSGYGSWERLTLDKDGYISVAKNKGKISPGDPIFFYCPKETDGKPYVHVVLYSGQDSKGYMKVYAHNNAMHNSIVRTRYCGYCNANTISAVYAYHMNGSGQKTETAPQYFDCKVQIDCINGKTINLYKNLSDSERVDYFDRGQSMVCAYGAKLDDGSTWYQVSARNAKGTESKYWFQYDSSNMTLKNLQQTKPVTAQFNVSSVTLDLTQNSSQTVTFTVGGDLPKGSAIRPSMSDRAVASASWGQKRVGRQSYPVITAKAAGTTQFTCEIINESTGAVLTKATLQIQVKAAEQPANNRQSQRPSYVPVVAEEWNGHYYCLYNSGQSAWEDAKAFCESVKGHLVTISSAAENDFVYNYMKNCGYQSAYFGLKRVQGQWTWCNGESVSYTNWAPGEPNNHGGTESYGMFYHKFEDGTWNDGDFHPETGSDVAFLCEWDG